MSPQHSPLDSSTGEAGGVHVLRAWRVRVGGLHHAPVLGMPAPGEEGVGASISSSEDRSDSSSSAYGFLDTWMVWRLDGALAVLFAEPVVTQSPIPVSSSASLEHAWRQVSVFFILFFLLAAFRAAFFALLAMRAGQMGVNCWVSLLKKPMTWSPSVLQYLQNLGFCCLPGPAFLRFHSACLRRYSARFWARSLMICVCWFSTCVSCWVRCLIHFAQKKFQFFENFLGK